MVLPSARLARAARGAAAAFLSLVALLGLSAPVSAAPASFGLVKDLNPTESRLNTAPTTSFSGAATIGDRALFIHGEPSTGLELWTSDGTPAGTRLVRDIYPGTASSNITELTAWNGKVYFVASDGPSNSELWVSDGTEAGTTMVRDIRPSGSSLPITLTPTSSGLFFFATGEARALTSGSPMAPPPAPSS